MISLGAGALLGSELEGRALWTSVLSLRCSFEEPFAIPKSGTPWDKGRMSYTALIGNIVDKMEKNVKRRSPGFHLGSHFSSAQSEMVEQTLRRTHKRREGFGLRAFSFFSIEIELIGNI